MVRTVDAMHAQSKIISAVDLLFRGFGLEEWRWFNPTARICHCRWIDVGLGSEIKHQKRKVELIFLGGMDHGCLPAV